MHRYFVSARLYSNHIKTEAAKSSLLLLSTKLVLLSSSSPPPFLRQIHLLNAYATSLGRYDASWAIRDLTRFYVALVKQAGVQIDIEEEGNAIEGEAKEAFARGDMVARDVNVHGENVSADGESGGAVSRELRQKEAAASQDRTRAALRMVLLSDSADGKSAKSVTRRAEEKAQSTLANEQLLGTFALSARLGKSATASASAGTITGEDTADVVPVLAGWSPIPGWAAGSSSSALRDPPADTDEESGSNRSASTSFTNAPFSNSSRGKSRSVRDSVQQQRSASARQREQVVLVPTESDPSAYAKQEAPRTKGLQEFLESESEEEEEQTDDEDDSDSESEGEEEQSGHPKKAAAVALATEGEEEDVSSESSSEEEDDDSEEEAQPTGPEQSLLASQ